MKIDETDKKILNVMLDNSKLPYREIAKKVGVSAVTVLKRVKELEKQKIIKKYSADIDFEKIGYDVTVIIKVKVAHGKTVQLGKKISHDSCVAVMYNVIGEFDSFIIAKFKTRSSLNKFLKRVQAFDFVKGTETTLVLDIIKEEKIKL